MICWITKKNALSGTRCEFVAGCGGEIWKTATAEDTHMRVVWRRTEQGHVRSFVVEYFGGNSI